MAIRRIGGVTDRYPLPVTPGIVSCIAIRCGIVGHRTGQIKLGCRLFRVTLADLSRSDFGPFSITAWPATFLTDAALASENYSVNTRVELTDKEALLEAGRWYVSGGLYRRGAHNYRPDKIGIQSNLNHGLN